MTITLNNNVKVNLDNSKKLVRWDMLQSVQPEKTEILGKWFVAMNCFPRAVSTPVVDITDGVVYAKTSCGISTDNKNYKSIVKYVRESVLENISYGAKNDCILGLHNNPFGRSLMGHRFISVADASVEYLEAIYAQYMENVKKGKEGKTTSSIEPQTKTENSDESLPESNISMNYNLLYSERGNELIQKIIKEGNKAKEAINKLNEVQFRGKVEDYYEIIEEIIDIIGNISDIALSIPNEEIITIGGIEVVKKEIMKSFEVAGIETEIGLKAITALKALTK